jgi:hypothetical protein
MNWDWIRTWSPLGLGIVLLGAAAVALEREQTDGAGALAGIGCLLIGVWLTVLLHDRFKDDDHTGGG